MLLLQCEKKVAESLQLEQYLKEQHEKAHQDRAAVFDAKDQQFSRFWRYGSRIDLQSHSSLLALCVLYLTLQSIITSLSYLQCIITS
jgi:hypothetical protein